MDNQAILRKLFDFIEEKLVVCAIYYGNKQGSDFDIFVVTRENTYYENIEHGDLDITVVGEEYLEYFITHLDPIVSEPILTGEMIIGDSISLLKERLLLITPNDDVVTHLMKSSDMVYGYAVGHFQIRDFKKTMENIVFSLSYESFARVYSERTCVIKFSELLEQEDCESLNEAHKCLKSKNFDESVLNKYIQIIGSRTLS